MSNYRNKSYVAFDADNDIKYYRLMQAWKANDNIIFNFHNAHELNNIRNWSNESTVKRRLRERLVNTKLMLVLVGESTKNLYKFVRWEIETGLSLKIPIVVINLNNKREMDNNLCPPILKDKLAMHIPFKQKIIQYSIDNWIPEHNRCVRNSELGNRHWIDRIYKDLNL